MSERAHRRSRRPLTLAAVALGVAGAATVGAWAGALAVSPGAHPAKAAHAGAPVWVAGANKAAKGVFVTTSYFTKPAEEFAERHPYKVVLIDGDLLARLMILHSVGVRIVETMHYKKVDDEYFPDE